MPQNIRMPPELRHRTAKRQPRAETQISAIFNAMPIDAMLRRIQLTPEHLPWRNASAGK
jgi:hypothetical protein